jgi:hypothetical protein
MVSVQLHAAFDVTTTDAEFPPEVVQPLNVGGANETDGPEAAVVPDAVEDVQVTAKPLAAVNTADVVNVAVNAVLAGVIVIAAFAGAAAIAMTATIRATGSSALGR